LKIQTITTAALLILVVGSTCLAPQVVRAQEMSATQIELARMREHIFGGAFMVTYPFEEFGDDYKTGYGIHGMLDYPLIVLFSLTADVGWNHFPSARHGTTSIDVWEFTFGGKLNLGPFFMGGETGYYTKVDEWSWVPTMGLRFGQFEGCLRIKAVSGDSWTGLRLGYYF